MQSVKFIHSQRVENPCTLKILFMPARIGRMNIHANQTQNPRDEKKNYTPCGRRQRPTRAPHKFAPCLDRELWIKYNSRKNCAAACFLIMKFALDLYRAAMQIKISGRVCVRTNGYEFHFLSPSVPSRKHRKIHFTGTRGEVFYIGAFSWPVGQCGRENLSRPPGRLQNWDTPPKHHTET